MGYIRSNKCPCCGGTNLIFDSLYQYGRQYKVRKDGKLSKNYKRVDYGPMECAYIFCKDCNWCSPDAENGVDDEGYLLIEEKWYEQEVEQ